MKVRHIFKYARSYNHRQTLLGKFFLDLPIKEKEDEITSYMDLIDHLGEDFPFMKVVESQENGQLSIENKKVEVISSYSYLDLSHEKEVVDFAIEYAKLYGTGNHGPRMLCGNLDIHEQFEKKLSAFFKKDHALVFSSGYLACMSVLTGIARKGDVLLMDKLCHNSLQTGAKLTDCQIIRFPHNDFKKADELISQVKVKGKLIVVIEGVYSMDGDIGDLPAARKLTDKYNGILICDEAHSLGTIGKTGRGAEEYFDYNYKADILCGSLTKSLGTLGGFIICSDTLRKFYAFHAHGAVFSAPLSAFNTAAGLKSLEIIEREPERVQRLQENADYFRSRLLEKGFNIDKAVTCVIPVIFRCPVQVLKIHTYLLKHGFFASAVMAPACPINAPRFRITAQSKHTKERIDAIVNILEKARELNPESSKIQEFLKAF